MKAQPILVVSGVLLFGGGVAALFAPQEIGVLLSKQGQPTSPVVVQLLGAGLFALGFLDWVARFSTIGGVYGRSVVVANVAYFFTTAATLVHHALRSERAGLAWLLACITGLLAVWFARFLLLPPKLVEK
jgi:hypothetical protein